MTRWAWLGFGALLLAVWAPAGAAEAGGQLRLRVDDTGADTVGTAELELRGRWKAVSGTVTLEHSAARHGADADRSRVNELYVAGEATGWTFSGGHRIVSWDVGYGFRPNDVVQEERRRTLLPVLPEGKAVLMAEHFGTEDALTLVAVDPTSSSTEHALAARAWRRIGAADWHVIARQGEDTGPSLGAAVSWVATDTLELHASARRAHEVDGQTGVNQALVGASWTGENRVSLLAEAWYDGAAPSDAAWADLRSLQGLAARAATLQNVRRRSVFLRLAWEHEGWEPSVDHLWLPSDRSHSTTVRLGWRGDRTRVDVGVRRLGGPSGAVMDLNPVNHIAFAAATWSF